MRLLLWGEWKQRVCNRAMHIMNSLEYIISLWSMIFGGLEQGSVKWPSPPFWWKLDYSSAYSIMI